MTQEVSLVQLVYTRLGTKSSKDSEMMSLTTL